MHYSNTILEEELKNKIAQDYFGEFDCTQIIGKVDFCVTLHSPAAQSQLFETQSIMWAEAKKAKSDTIKSIVQLILTIGKARTFDKVLPPAFLGAFDAHGISFIPYNDIHEVFYQNDFNWNVTPSDHESREFIQLHSKVKESIQTKSLQFDFEQDQKELKTFIKQNFIRGSSDVSKIKIDKNNFFSIYNKWVNVVKPSINFPWDKAKKIGIIDADFYLADLLSSENQTFKDNLYVQLQKTEYELDRKLDEYEMFSSKTAVFMDNQKAHQQFWNRYERPPSEEYRDYIVERRDLLVPQDVRERKGSFFTPQCWVELSQQYLRDVFGENWQDEYYIWDCAAGTGNLLAGLTNKYNIYASTLDKQDVDVMNDRIKNGTNLLSDHVFQFDFLNDEFTDPKVPQSLQKILQDPEKRKKFIIYINPPYAESNGKISNTRSKVHENKTYNKYVDKLEKVGPELFAQFLARIYFEIPDCKIGQFSTLKLLSGGNSSIFRSYFLAELKKSFVVPADTFDNVKGVFPIGFFVWNLENKIKFESVESDVFDRYNNNIGTKTFYSYDKEKGRINDWIDCFKISKDDDYIGVLVGDAPDFQNNNQICILDEKSQRNGKYILVNKDNIIHASIYFSVRHVFEATWLNDRDQFLYPKAGWHKDQEFQNDCLTYTLFTSKNRISGKSGINHWIPFTEVEVNARTKFESSFMADYIAGKIKKQTEEDIFNTDELELEQCFPLEFSDTAKCVFDAGRELWKYYHSKSDCNVNASLYDIKAYFQGRNESGRMNNQSTDETYTTLIANLRDSLKVLTTKIQPKVYEYGFLKK